MGWAKRVFGSGDQKEAGWRTRIRTLESEREVTLQRDDEVWDLPEERREAGDRPLLVVKNKRPHGGASPCWL